MEKSVGEDKQSISRRQFLYEAGRFAVASIAGYVGARELILNLPGTETANYELVYNPHTPIKDSRGRVLEMVGVRHVHANLLKHYDDIEQRVVKSDLVLLEYFFDGIRKYAKPGVDTFNLQPQNMSDTDEMFFGGIGQLCAKHDKEVVVVNPETAILQEIELYKLFGLSVGAGMEWTLSGRKGKKINRRQFLQYAGGAVATITWASVAGLTNKLRSVLETRGVLTSDLPQNEQANLLGYGIIDWRDVRTAWGIQRMTKDLNLPANSVMEMFQGEGHGGMLEYLKDPERLKAKMAFYQMENKLGEEAVRMYKFNHEKNVWEISRKIAY